MTTLQDVTLAHSRRLSDIHKAGDAQAAGALLRRDVKLRALGSTAKAYAQFDEAVASAEEKRTAAEQKAAAARMAALDATLETRDEGLAAAARRAADLAAMEVRLKAEAAAERKYREALSVPVATLPLAERQRLATDADRARRTELDAAQSAHAEALAAAQSGYRSAVDGAVIDEWRLARAADRDYTDGVRRADAALSAAKAAARRTLQSSLSAIDEAREVLTAWQREAAAAAEATSRLESDEFDRFRQELQAVRT